MSLPYTVPFTCCFMDDTSSTIRAVRQLQLCLGPGRQWPAEGNRKPEALFLALATSKIVNF